MFDGTDHMKFSAIAQAGVLTRPSVTGSRRRCFCLGGGVCAEVRGATASEVTVLRIGTREAVRWWVCEQVPGLAARVKLV